MIPLNLTTSRFLVMAAFVAASATVPCLGADELKVAAPEWFKAKPEQTFVAEVTLKPGESKTVSVKAKKPTVVGFQTNLTSAQAKQFEKTPIVISTGGESLESSFGAWTSFEPRGGTITLKVQNKTSIEVQVVIYTMEEI